MISNNSSMNYRIWNPTQLEDIRFMVALIDRISFGTKLRNNHISSLLFYRNCWISTFMVIYFIEVHGGERRHALMWDCLLYLAQIQLEAAQAFISAWQYLYIPHFFNQHVNAIPSSTPKSRNLPILFPTFSSVLVDPLPALSHTTD